MFSCCWQWQDCDLKLMPMMSPPLSPGWLCWYRKCFYFPCSRFPCSEDVCSTRPPSTSCLSVSPLSRGESSTGWLSWLAYCLWGSCLHRLRGGRNTAVDIREQCVRETVTQAGPQRFQFLPRIVKDFDSLQPQPWPAPVNCKPEPERITKPQAGPQAGPQCSWDWAGTNPCSCRLSDYVQFWKQRQLVWLFGSLGDMMLLFHRVGKNVFQFEIWSSQLCR